MRDAKNVILILPLLFGVDFRQLLPARAQGAAKGLNKSVPESIGNGHHEGDSESSGVTTMVCPPTWESLAWRV
jgi:hypothetical protein